MRLVNDARLPEPIIRALEADDYDSGDSDITVTQLINPPLIRQLRKKHEAEIEEKASSRMFSLMGKMIHKILETAGSNAEGLNHLLFEKRLFIERDGWKISGQIDVIDTEAKTITDYKVCSFWTSILGAKDEWTSQLNLYRLLAKENGYQIDRLEIAALFRDWSAEKIGTKRDYPEAPMQIIDIPVWSIDSVERYLNGRIRAHKSSKPSICTPDERWERGDKYAVKKEGRATAIRVLDSHQEAVSWIALNARPEEIGKMSIEHRRGEPKRCLRYCSVAPFCDFGKKLLRKEK